MQAVRWLSLEPFRWLSQEPFRRTVLLQAVWWLSQEPITWLSQEPFRRTVLLRAVRRPTAEQQGSSPGDCPIAAKPDDHWDAAAIPMDSRIAESPDAYWDVAGSQVTIQSQTVERATRWQQPFQKTVG